MDDSNRSWIFGKITNQATGYPAAGARVTLVHGSDIVANSDSDPTGYYSIKGLRPGRYALVVHIGYNIEVLRTEFDLHEGPNPYDIAI